MSFSVATDREVPDATLVTEYSVGRLGKYPSISIKFAEVMYDVETPVIVDSTEDNDADGKLETLVVSAWAGQSGLVGKELRLTDGSLIGTVSTYTDAHMDGTVSVPAKLTLTTPLVTDITGQNITYRLTTSIGTPVYRNAKGGRQWEARFNSSFADGLSLIQQMMGNAYYNAASAVITQLGLAATSQDIQAAIQALANQEKNIDGYLAEQAEILEQNRRGGSYPWMSTLGDVPLV